MLSKSWGNESIDKKEKKKYLSNNLKRAQYEMLSEILHGHSLKSHGFAQLLVEAKLYSEVDIQHLLRLLHILEMPFISEKNKHFNDNQHHILTEYNFKIDTLEKLKMFKQLYIRTR